jgi:hypothetical protein
LVLEFVHFGAMSTKRYIGKLCELHPELQGERLSSNRRCVRCHRERRGRWKVANVEHVRAGERDKQKRWRQAHPDEARAGSAARAAMKRARSKEPTPLLNGGVNRAFAKLSRKAHRLRMVVDHVIPLAPCRVCSAQGTHEPSNWQLLTRADNSRKGNRCQDCWMPNLMPKSGHVLS